MNFNYTIVRNGESILGALDETTAQLVAAVIRREIGGDISVGFNEW